MSFEVLVQKRLVLPDDETTRAAGTDCAAASLIVDIQASLVALATQHDLPLFSGGVTANPSGLIVRAGQGITSTVNISRLTRSLGESLPRFVNDVSNARGLVLRQKVVAKCLSRRNDIDLSKKLGSMAKEIRILGQARLRRHENLVRLIGVDWEGTHTDDPESKSRWPLLLMEYADCGTLTDFFTLDIDINWDVKANIAYDIASGLEALDDASVTHGDLTFSNVLMFRTGDGTFRAKLCDFGFAMVATDYDDVPIRQIGFTPPWDAPESSQDLEIDDLYKVDIYTYGLLVCRIFLHGGDPFEFKYRSEKSRPANSKAACIKIWKVSDKVVNIAKDIVRRYPDLEYTKDQLTILDDIFALTLRTAPKLRADEYAEIKKVIKPNAADEEAQRR
jgi:serine/threonine protein kinase